MAARKNPPVCIDLTGNTYGYLTVEKRAADYVKASGKKETAWVCRCVCGKEVTVIGYTLKRKGGTCKFSCGCKREEMRKQSLADKGKPASPFAREEVREKAAQTKQDRYGTENTTSLEQVRAKIQQTNLQRYGTSCPLACQEVKEKGYATSLQKYGFRIATQDIEIRKKSLRKRKDVNALTHWQTQEELLCQGGYEVRVVDYLNRNRIPFLWQPHSFAMPDGRSYTPDVYFPSLDLWVDIKGRWFDHATPKIEWFSSLDYNFAVWEEPHLKLLGVDMKTPLPELVKRHAYGV